MLTCNFSLKPIYIDSVSLCQQSKEQGFTQEGYYSTTNIALTKPHFFLMNHHQ